MSHRLQVLIPESLNKKLAKAAQRNRVSKGEWVRRAIEQFVSPPKAESDPLTRLAALRTPTSDIEQMLSEIDKGRA
jgi:metal-responsive CopG/Arc/MetJ family transcriptional regulator